MIPRSVVVTYVLYLRGNCVPGDFQRPFLPTPSRQKIPLPPFYVASSSDAVTFVGYRPLPLVANRTGCVCLVDEQRTITCTCDIELSNNPTTGAYKTNVLPNSLHHSKCHIFMPIFRSCWNSNSIAGWLTIRINQLIKQVYCTKPCHTLTINSTNKNKRGKSYTWTLIGNTNSTTGSSESALPPKITTPFSNGTILLLILSIKHKSNHTRQVYWNKFNIKISGTFYS